MNCLGANQLQFSRLANKGIELTKEKRITVTDISTNIAKDNFTCT